MSTVKLKKENSIITNLSEIDYLISDETLRKDIKQMLSPRESIDNIRPKLHIPILLLYECEITKRHNLLTNSYKYEILEYHKSRAESYFKKQINQIGTVPLYSAIKFHFILFPVPSKKEIIEKFISNVKHYKNQ